MFLNYDGWAFSFSIEDFFIVAAMAQLWRSATENDRHEDEEKFVCKGEEEPLFLGWSGGSGEGKVEFELEEAESSLVILLLLSELLNATAKASALLLTFIVLLEIPPPLLLKG